MRNKFRFWYVNVSTQLIFRSAHHLRRLMARKSYFKLVRTKKNQFNCRRWGRITSFFPLIFNSLKILLAVAKVKLKSIKTFEETSLQKGWWNNEANKQNKFEVKVCKCWMIDFPQVKAKTIGEKKEEIIFYWWKIDKRASLEMSV